MVKLCCENVFQYESVCIMNAKWIISSSLINILIKCTRMWIQAFLILFVLILLYML